ncbi:hypothetical protein HK098_001778 [Nowakowskiella sp. JEL0407]|nr:hypothetical protein HK098_001778 [Nowakowskiella sp. JEL0407]
MADSLEEKLALKTLEYLSKKSKILDESRKLEKNKALLQEISAELNALQNEKTELIEILSKVNSDLQIITQTERAMRLSYNSSANSYSNQISSFNSLKDEIDTLRQQHGLGNLPNLQDELDLEMARYLAERRQRWHIAGLSVDPPDDEETSISNQSPTSSSIHVAETPPRMNSASSPASSTSATATITTPVRIKLKQPKPPDDDDSYKERSEDRSKRKKRKP